MITYYTKRGDTFEKLPPDTTLGPLQAHLYSTIGSLRWVGKLYTHHILGPIQDCELWIIKDDRAIVFLECSILDQDVQEDLLAIDSDILPLEATVYLSLRYDVQIIKVNSSDQFIAVKVFEHPLNHCLLVFFDNKTQ